MWQTLMHGVLKFFNERTPREKNLLLLFLFSTLFFVDYTFLIHPVQNFLGVNTPKLREAKKELKTLRQDKKNKTLIEIEWNNTQAKLLETEKKFVDPNEMSAVLQDLSEMASLSGVKIISIKPSESAAVQKGRGYESQSIRINALAGSHETGKFLAKFETKPVFFKVAEVKITENTQDVRRHFVDLELLVYRKGAAA